MWTRNDFRSLVDPAAIGMIHLQPLPGSPLWEGPMAAVVTAALADAEALHAGGIRALMMENYHDVPFRPEHVPPATVAAMTVVAAALRNAFPDTALGINVLRNDAEAALGIAAATGSRFIRINVHVGAAVTDQGTIEGRAWRTLRRRRELEAADVGILADLRVKHARPLAERPLAEEARDLRLRGLADAVILTGAATGAAADPDDLRRVRDALPDCPLLVGSGMTAANAARYLEHADGCIVGSSLKDETAAGGTPGISAAKTAAFLTALAAGR